MIKKVNNYFNNSVKLIELKKFKDSRGLFSELYKKKEYNSIDIKEIFNQENFSFTNKKNSIRGLHFQKKPHHQAKLITVLNGEILDVVVDLRKRSQFFGKYKSFILSSSNMKQLYIPEGFAHGFKTLKKNTIVIYNLNRYYNPNSEHTIIWNDQNLKVNWKLNGSKPILSLKDKNGLNFNPKNKYF